MQTRLKISGHPVHPLMMTLPLGLFVCAVLFDLGGVAGSLDFLGQVGYWTLVAGLFAAMLAVGAGMIDLWDVPGGAGKRRAVAYQFANLGMVALFAIACLGRVDAQTHPPTTGLFLVELLALAAGGFGAWLGATMVRQFRIGAEPDVESTTRFFPADARRPRPRPAPDA
ncbi:DUF2231 domain-containing protein [Phytohabitans rumicis]|uniref:DUF2231 domain-containing protein n=1 Tax=Phytohabitans rumicis TaxID=1076125 RepID=A0A6V8L3E2_9ACTN|nr:DUF2231 domain-containing protein [Phytohabitans rumicis]GFJ90070.1 hypothetical protein Prum_037120 [Phytohabitans rumicis]